MKSSWLKQRRVGAGQFFYPLVLIFILLPDASRATVTNWGDNLYGQSPSNPPGGLNGAKAVAAGYWHNLAVKSAGGVVAWGLNSFGQTNVPTFLVTPTTPNRAIAVAAGHDHSLALYATNRLVIGWGDNTYDQISIPPDLFNITAIAAGGFHSAALKSDGSVVCWGYDFYGQADVPAAATNVIAIACGNAFTLALRSDGTVIGWGDDFYDQTTIPADVTNAIGIAAGFAHGLAVKSDGTVIGWGDTTLGQGAPPSDLTNVIAVAAGYAHSLALRSNGSVVSWGDNSSGQTNVPPGFIQGLAVSAGYAHSLVLKDDKPRITAPPQNVFTNAGSTARFAVSVTGTAPLAYRWWFNNTNNVGTTTSSSSTTNALTLLNVSTTNGGHYSVVITNMFGGVTSQVAMLIVDGYGGVSSPVILTNPANKSVNLGGSATFSVVADGTPPLSYQWQSVVTNQPGVDFPDATNTSYTVNNAQETDAHSYRVVITNLGGTVTSSIATLTVRLPPAITNQPVDVTTNIGATVLLSVSATGFAPLTYRWWFNDTNLVSTSNTVRLVNVSTNNAGTFFAIVTNVAGAATSQVATLSVIDDGSEPVIAPVILTNPQNQTVNLGDAAIFSVAASGTPPLSYQWQFIVTNQPLTSLPNATNSSHAVNYALAADAGNYRVVVTNAGGAVTSSFASLTVRLPPAITNQPVGVTTNVGATVRFVVGASGSGPLNYHWFFGTTSIAGNSSSLLLSNVQTNQAGNYFVIVTNFLGSATSHVAALDLFYLPSQTPAQIFASLHPGGSLLYLTVAFEAGKNYRIQTSTNMATWEDLTNFVSTAPIMEFTNALAPNVNQMYFRLVSP